MKCSESDQPISFLERCKIVDGDYIAATESLTETSLEIIPIFARCGSLEQMKIQFKLFTKDEATYARHSIIHVQSMINDQLDPSLIRKFMQSISVIVTEKQTRFCIKENHDLLCIYNQKIVRNPHISMTQFKQFVNYWDLVYNEKPRLSENIVNEEAQQENKHAQWQRLYSLISEEHQQKEHYFENQKEKKVQQNELKKDQYKVFEYDQIKLQEIAKYKCTIVICKMKLPQTLRLIPNQDIIIGRITQSGQQIDSKYKVYYNYTHNYKLKQLSRWTQELHFQPQQITYEGSLNLQGLEESKNAILKLRDSIKYEGNFQEGVFNGQGRLTLKYGYLEGEFQNGYAHGKCSDQYGEGQYYYNQRHGQYTDKFGNVSYYEDAQQVQYQVKNRDVKAMLYIANQNQNYIDNFCLRTLLPNQWLQMKIVDYYLDAVQLQYKIKGIRVINTCDAQDIFGSLIQRNQFRKDIKINHSEFNRIILVINMNQSHFITLAYENHTFYVFDSLNYKYDDLLYNFCQVIGLQYSQTKIINASELNQLRQHNMYDCGLHALFNAYQLYTRQELKNINFTPDNVDLRRVRKQLRSIVEDNYVSLDIFDKSNKISQINHFNSPILILTISLF